MVRSKSRSLVTHRRLAAAAIVVYLSALPSQIPNYRGAAFTQAACSLPRLKYAPMVLISPGTHDFGSCECAQSSQPPQNQRALIQHASFLKTWVSVVAAIAMAFFMLESASLAVSPQAPPDGTCVGCLGVVDGLLYRCTGDLKGCVSSQDDRPEVFEPPWVLPELGRLSDDSSINVGKYMKKLQQAVNKAGGSIIRTDDNGRYLRAEFRTELPFLGKDVDDCEWYFTPGDLTVQFRGERRSGGSDFGENRRRLDQLRQDLGWDVLPMVRNRQRALFFAESPLDRFGPALYDALRPDGEPTPYEASVLDLQGESIKSGKNMISNNPLATDDLGIENETGVLDKATRDFLRKTCDAKSQICE